MVEPFRILETYFASSPSFPMGAAAPMILAADRSLLFEAWSCLSLLLLYIWDGPQWVQPRKVVVAICL
jgi:hypothetical protein